MEVVYLLFIVVVLLLLGRLYISCKNDVTVWESSNQEQFGAAINRNNQINKTILKVSEPSQLTHSSQNEGLRRNNDDKALEFQSRRPAPLVSTTMHKLSSLSSRGTDLRARLLNI